MSQIARVQGCVEYRLGDGPLMQVPLGEVEVDRGPGDVTLSWGDGDTRQSAAIPAGDFERHVARRIIEWPRRSA